MLPFKQHEQILNQKFLDKNKKGPLQFFIPKALGLVGVGYYDEYTHRIPFAVAGLLSVGIMFLIVHELTGSSTAGFISASMYGVNGLIVALTRIVQYQSINMLFSLLSLYLFIRYYKSQKLGLALLGGLFFSISFLTHWDAVLFAPIIAYPILSKKRLKHIVLTGLLVVVLCGSYALPFYMHMRGNSDKQNYFNNRLGVSVTDFSRRITKLRFTYELYNPFISFYVLAISTILFVVILKSFPQYMMWYIFTVLFYIFLVRSAGTHIYNVVITFSICLGLTISTIQKKLPQLLSLLPVLPFIPLLLFLAHQSHVLFIDHRREYPWETEKITQKYITRKYQASDIPNFKLGFTYFRDYELLRAELEKRFTDYTTYTFVTNDYKGVLKYYLDLNHKPTNKMFVIGVKNPFTFVTDYNFSQYKKTRLFSIRNEYSHIVIRVSTGSLKEIE